jgi:hypothetical protein
MDAIQIRGSTERDPLTHPVIASLDHPLSGKPERG